MITKPLINQLHLLQLEGYELGRYIRYLKTRQKFEPENRTPLVWTWKAKTLYRLALLWYLPFVFLTLFVNGAYLIVPIIFIYYPAIPLIIALLTLRPWELYNKHIAIRQIRKYIQNRKQLITIAITGSFGKTSTKDFLYTILKKHNSETVKSPASYNTVFGLKKTVDFEISSKTNYFIAEMGAFVRGEIKELCFMIPPGYSLLTAIGSQHLERFKTLSNTTLAKFEIIDAVDPQNALVNLDNSYIKKHLAHPQYSGVKTYSLIDPKADFYVASYKMTSSGMEFTLKHKKNIYTLESSLFGTVNLENLAGAVSMAIILGIPKDTIQKAVPEIISSPHRLQLKKIKSATLIDNAYSSNEIGFEKVTVDIAKLKGKKAIITPGLVELGIESDKIHKALGKLLPDVFDSIILVGQSDRTKALEAGVRENNPKAKISYIQKAQLWEQIDKLADNYDWILLENDLPDQY